ncbi:ATP-binding protein [Streptomyces phaeoluteigriseus]|uniref:ATP-binding protein n=1 Tax=Streptomyces phaeoluteigriseus TaxID=114686 RepID=UPI003EBFBBA8
MTGWSVCEDTCDTAALVISELVTNAIVHTASGVVVCELYDGGDLVRIAVRDEGCAPGEPHPSPQRPDEEHGRGLFLVDALCHSWGAQEHGPGLLVWADLPRQASAEHPAELREDLADTDRAPAPRADLGWGARPKPGPADGPEDEGEAPAEQGDHGDAVHRGPGPGPVEQVPRAHPAEAHPSGHTHRPHHSPATDGRADPRPSGPLGRLPRLSDGPLSRVAPQWHRGSGTGGPSLPADRTDHALDTTGGAPAWRPHPGAGAPALPPRDRDTA